MPDAKTAFAVYAVPSPAGVDVTEPVELTYTVAKNTSLTGNTILLAESEQSVDWDVLLPLLFIPLLAMIIIFFNHFHNKEE